MTIYAPASASSPSLTESSLRFADTGQRKASCSAALPSCLRTRRGTHCRLEHKNNFRPMEASCKYSDQYRTTTWCAVSSALTGVRMLVAGLVLALLAGPFVKLKVFGGGQ